MWRLSVIRDGEYRYWEINKFKENATGLLNATELPDENDADAYGGGRG